MKFKTDEKYFLSCLESLLAVPSPTGYYVKLNPLLEEITRSLGKTVTYDNKSTAYITLEGEDTSKTVLVGAHADTIGLMVRTVDGDGKIRLRNLGGVNYANLEGETVLSTPAMAGNTRGFWRVDPIPCTFLRMRGPLNETKTQWFCFLMSVCLPKRTYMLWA